MVKILIIGGTGFIGSYLINAFKKYDLIVADKRIKNMVKGVKYIECDITNPKEVKEIIKDDYYVYHLAAILDESVPKKKIFDVNVGGTLNVLEACREKKIKRLIYLSTTGVMGETKNKSDEKKHYNPKTDYEKSKALAENLVREYYKRYKIPTIIIRSALVYGPNNYWLKIMKKAKKSFPILGSGKNKIQFIYIKNLISALTKARTRGRDGEIYLVADENPTDYKDFYKILREELRIEKEPSNVPIFIGKMIASLYKFFGKKSLVTKEHIDRLTRNRWYDIRKAKKELGYDPKYEIRKGLKETIKYFKNEELL